jgi:hypothetical protein
MRASFSPDHKKQEGASRTLVVEYDDDFPGSPDSSITRSIQLTRTTGRQRCIHDRRKASMSGVHASAASRPFSTWRHFLSSPQISLCCSLPR